MNIDNAIRVFSQFLNVSWNIVNPLLLNRSYTSNEGSISDWLQANWEILIERNVLELKDYLEVYGDGADFNGNSSRITDTNACSTYEVQIFGKDAKVIDLLNNERIRATNLIFENLVGFENGFYLNAPPFNYVLTHDKETGIERVFHIESIKFELIQIL